MDIDDVGFIIILVELELNVNYLQANVTKYRCFDNKELFCSMI